MRAYYQVDLNFSHAFMVGEQPLTGFLNISNLFNAQGGIYQVACLYRQSGHELSRRAGCGSGWPLFHDRISDQHTISLRTRTMPRRRSVIKKLWGAPPLGPSQLNSNNNVTGADMANRNFLRTMLAGTVSALALAGGAAAQQSSTESVTVTGTRIENGSGMPTPVTVVSTDQLLTLTPTSIPEALAQLPMFAPTLGTTSHTEPNGRGFGTPTNNLNLHGLGVIRTLVLMDGKRVPGTFYDTTVNVDMLPQMLVQRVDVVTGGASAVYGSDAVAGVVNYVLDHNFNGFKGLLQGGLSERGDAATVRAGFAAGLPVLNDRGHFEVSAEYFSRDSIPDATARPYGDPAHSCQTTGSSTSSTNPQVMSCNIRQANASPFGLITSGPLRGTQFSADGKSIIPFNAGTPTGTGNANQGGDGGVLHNQTLISANHNGQAYARFDYDLTNDLSFYTDARYGSSWTAGASQGLHQYGRGLSDLAL